MKLALQQIRIAEACGFDKSHWLELGGGIVFGTSGILPDYPNDLNAMHEAEKVLTAEQRRSYVNRIFNLPVSECESNTFATAAQRAEAFLRTLNLWEI